MRRARILFLAEAVTLAHVARPLVLARGLDPSRFEVVLATAPRFRDLWWEAAIPVRPIHSIPSARFLSALASGGPMYGVETLRSYVCEDLEVIRETAPDAVVGDFRLSLAVSARVAKVPYLTITNAYWSPYARRRIPMPELPLTRRLGVPLARPLFRAAWPVAFARHAAPHNRIRREYGLPTLGNDLRAIYTEADRTLYAEVPELVPTYDRPAHHHYLGPILWSPAVAPPSWWSDLPGDRPAIYVNLGSSGRAGLLDAVLDALADLPVLVLAADLGRGTRSVPRARNVRLALYLPGIEAATRARVVLCNGGSPTAHQALAAGTPVLGLPSNMDQHLNMGAVQEQGAGVLLRSEYASPAAIRAAVSRLLSDPSFAEAAARIARNFATYDPPARLQALLTEQRAHSD